MFDKPGDKLDDQINANDEPQVLKVVKAKFIEEHYNTIMEDNRKVLVTIRDDGNTSSRDKIEASKLLARMVSGLQAEKATTTIPNKVTQEKLKLSKSESDRIKKIAGLKRTRPTIS